MTEVWCDLVRELDMGRGKALCASGCGGGLRGRGLEITRQVKGGEGLEEATRN